MEVALWSKPIAGILLVIVAVGCAQKEVARIDTRTPSSTITNDNGRGTWTKEDVRRANCALVEHLPENEKPSGCQSTKK